MENSTVIQSQLLVENSTQKTLFIIGVGFGMISLTIMFGNSLVILAVRRFKQLQTLTNKFVVSLAVSDLIAGIFIIWQSVFNFKPEMELDGALCLSRFIQILPSYASVLNLFIIAWDRYLAILHPFRYQELMTPKVANILIAVTWILALGLTAAIMGNSHFTPGVSHCSMVLMTNPFVLVSVFHGVSTVLLLTMFYLYGHIFVVARKQMKQIMALEAMAEGHKEVKNLGRELKAAKSLAFILAVFIVCNIPGYVVGIIGVMRLLPDETIIVYYKVGIMCMFLNSVMNPVVYALKSKEFKEAFRRILCKPKIPLGQPEDILGFSESNGIHITTAN